MKLTILAAAATILSFGLLEEPLGRAWGSFEARYHLSRGHHRFYIGAAPSLFPVYSGILRERYGFNEVFFVGCTCDGWDCGYVTGYSSATDPVFEAMYGRDFWIEALKAAEIEVDESTNTPTWTRDLEPALR